MRLHGYFSRLNGARPKAEPDAVIAFINGHLEAGTFRKPVLGERDFGISASPAFLN